MFSSSKLSFLLLCILYSTFQSNLALVGFDCITKPMNITSISLSEIPSCLGSDLMIQPTIVKIQLIQTKRFEKLHVIYCLLEVSTIIQHCGMHSHSSMAASGFTIGEVTEISYNDCFHVHSKGNYSPYTGTVIAGIKGNSSGTYPVLVAGTISSNNGQCEGGSYTLGSTFYSGVTVTKSYKITLRDEFADVNTEDGTLHASSGQSHSLSLGTGFDPDYGYGFWDSSKISTECHDTSHLVLYTGIAYIFNSLSNDQTLIINTTSHALAVELRKPTIVCGQHGYASEHPKLSIIVSPNGVFYFKSAPLIPENMDTFLYTNSKFVFIERHFSGQLTSLYNFFRQRMCQLRHQQLLHLISLAYVSPDDFAWSYTKRPGYTAMRRGEVVYLLACHAITVDFRPTEKCFQQLPVYHGNSSKFLAPRSRIIVDYGTEIDCNPLAPVMFKIGSTWKGMSPNLHNMDPPLELSPIDNETWSYQHIDNLGTSGLYTQEDLEKYQTRLMFGAEKPAITNIIVSKSAGLDVSDQDVDIGPLMGPNSLRDMQVSLFKKLYGYYWEVCIQVAGLTGFFLIIMFIKAILGMLINGSLLYKVYGCSFKVLSALWGTLAKHVLYFKLLKKVAAGVNNDVELGNLPTAPKQSNEGTFNYQPSSEVNLYPNFQD